MNVELQTAPAETQSKPAVAYAPLLIVISAPSGGGKTTVLRMIAGLESPTDGDIFIRGQRMNDVPVQQRNIGFVFQSYALFKTMSVADNIAFGLKIKKWARDKREQRIAELEAALLALREQVRTLAPPDPPARSR